MQTYPDHFIDADGYEWERGTFVVNKDPEKEVVNWRFRATRFCKVWPRLQQDDKEWDHATTKQLLDWNIQVKKKLN